MTSKTPAEKKNSASKKSHCTPRSKSRSLFLFCPTDYCGRISSWAHEYFGGIQESMRIYNGRRAYGL